MKATLILKHREVISKSGFVEPVVWLLEQGLEGSSHTMNYPAASCGVSVKTTPIDDSNVVSCTDRLDL